MHAEGELDPYLESWLEGAVSEQRLISVRSLSSPFSAKTEEAYLSYAESQSLVAFLLRDYGGDKMLHLLTLLRDGTSCDEALTEIYGFDQDGLDELWREYITNRAQSESKLGRVPPWRIGQGETPWDELLRKALTSKASIVLVGAIS